MRSKRRIIQIAGLTMLSVWVAGRDRIAADIRAAVAAADVEGFRVAWADQLEFTAAAVAPAVGAAKWAGPSLAAALGTDP